MVVRKDSEKSRCGQDPGPRMAHAMNGRQERSESHGSAPQLQCLVGKDRCSARRKMTVVLGWAEPHLGRGLMGRPAFPPGISVVRATSPRGVNWWTEGWTP